MVGGGAAGQVVLGAAIAFFDTFSRVVSFAFDVSWQALIATISVVIVNPAFNCRDFAFNFSVAIDYLVEQVCAVFSVYLVLPEVVDLLLCEIRDGGDGEGVLVQVLVNHRINVLSKVRASLLYGVCKGLVS